MWNFGDKCSQQYNKGDLTGSCDIKTFPFLGLSLIIIQTPFEQKLNFSFLVHHVGDPTDPWKTEIITIEKDDKKCQR